MRPDKQPWQCPDCGNWWKVSPQLFLALEGDGMAGCPSCVEAKGGR